jgi:hypothetical protein
LTAYPLKSELRQGHKYSPFLLNRVLEFLARVIRQDKETEGIKIGKEEITLIQFPDGMVLQLRDLNTSPKSS